MRNGNRTVEVNKQHLIEKIKENQKAHTVEYKKAVIAYKEEALRQLVVLTDNVSNGDLGIRLDLITPVDNTKQYSKKIELFEWDVREVVDLSQSEFQELVQDETDFAINAKFANQSYLG